APQRRLPDLRETRGCAVRGLRVDAAGGAAPPTTARRRPLPRPALVRGSRRRPGGRSQVPQPAGTAGRPGAGDGRPGPGGGGRRRQHRHLDPHDARPPEGPRLRPGAAAGPPRGECPPPPARSAPRARPRPAPDRPAPGRATGGPPDAPRPPGQRAGARGRRRGDHRRHGLGCGGVAAQGRRRRGVGAGCRPEGASSPPRSV
ncbi:MAG: Competence protein F homolog, phosphoribosyltransferase domain; protein YhgH required for utilization of DNA as sole source of carbon and energy, partial [uncultured Acidimicrobiales bacterium]